MEKIKFFNTAIRKKEEFETIKKGFVGIYSCGPTVYWYQHIGNMYAYIQWDILVRFLKYMGYQVKWVMNITDVGHMTSDEDTGEDKMEKGAKREKMTVWQIADKYIKQFLESLDLLNIQRPDVLCRATENIKEQIDLIKKIEARGFTYKTKTGLVFDTSKFKDYPNFAKLDLKKQQAGARVEVDREKKQPWDFLLWVTNQPKHIMQWDSPWGRGFPGWHIECTAMSIKYLGERFDIHTGGIEHIPIHHTNEIAQAYGAFSHQTANYWLHNGWLVIKNEKISKSLGNIILVSDIQRKGFNPLAFRYLALNSHYRQGTNFTWESLRASQTALDNLRSVVIGLRQKRGKSSQVSPEELAKVNKYQKDFVDALADDLNTPRALAVLQEVVKSNIPGREKLDMILDFDQIFGLKLAFAQEQEVVIPEEIKELVAKREELRKQGKWSEADKIRQEIAKKGFVVEDRETGSQVKKY